MFKWTNLPIPRFYLAMHIPSDLCHARVLDTPDPLVSPRRSTSLFLLRYFGLKLATGSILDAGNNCPEASTFSLGLSRLVDHPEIRSLDNYPSLIGPTGKGAQRCRASADRLAGRSSGHEALCYIKPCSHRQA